ncbi:MAG TPA: AIR synthase-related protein, partial [Candidatus Sumerlaeota bacterium]|nr:AIR synthase-related protein [Candidatus Sumerlaeota bacterium]
MGPCPELDLAFEKRLQDTLRDMIAAGMARSAQDISEGGLAVTLAECCMQSAGLTGAEITLPSGVSPAIELFSEEPSRVVISCPAKDGGKVLDLARKAGIPAAVIGKTGGDALDIRNVLHVPVKELKSAWESFSL